MLALSTATALGIVAGSFRPHAQALDAERGPKDARISIRPLVVYAGGTATVRLGAPSRGAPERKIRWEASGGLLLADDLEEVEWRAPALPGPQSLAVTLQDPGTGSEVRLEQTVEVREPSTEGMVWIPAGEFLRGDIQGTLDTTELKTVQNSSDEPYHKVHLDGYWIDRRPVTHREFAEFLTDIVRQGLARPTEIGVMGEFDGSWVPLYYFQSYEDLIADFQATRNARMPFFLHAISWDGKRFCIKSGQEDHPAVDVTWFGAAAFARHRGKSLPTEAQWEKAARGADGRRFPWGNNLPTAYHANVEGHAGKESAPAGHFSPAGDSPYGVADMVSDAFEWTGDWFNPDYYADYGAEETLRNPRGPFWGKSHTIRGFPSALQARGSPDHLEPVSTRYDWRFEFLLGDSFANSRTTFRTVLERGEAPGASR